MAARNVNTACISLLHYGHDVHWPSEDLDGQPPLAELRYAAQGEGPKWERVVEKAISALTPLLSHTWRSPSGKTVLHSAIDNPTTSLSVLRTFLRVSQL